MDSFSLFNCVNLGTSDSYLIDNLDLKCDEGAIADIYFPLEVIMLILWGILLPLLLFLKLRAKLSKYTTLEEKYKNMATYSFLISGFKGEYYYWEFVR